MLVSNAIHNHATSAFSLAPALVVEPASPVVEVLLVRVGREVELDVELVEDEDKVEVV